MVRWVRGRFFWGGGVPLLYEIVRPNKSKYGGLKRPGVRYIWPDYFLPPSHRSDNR
jgi:hypothetical protein